MAVVAAAVVAAAAVVMLVVARINGVQRGAVSLVAPTARM